MSWTEGHQHRRTSTLRSNEELLKLHGFIDEREAKLALYEFLRNNTTFAVDLILGVKLFPFQHLAIKSMFETDYFLGVWARGMSKSFTTGIFAALDAVLNQGVEIGILSKSLLRLLTADVASMACSRIPLEMNSDMLKGGCPLAV